MKSETKTIRLVNLHNDDEQCEDEAEFEQDVNRLQRKHQPNRTNLLADLGIFGNFQGIVDVTISSPTAPSIADDWISTLLSTRREDRSIDWFMQRLERTKITFYNCELRRMLHLAKEIDALKHLKINFIPCAMSTYGNIGPAFRDLLSKLAALKPSPEYYFSSIHTDETISPSAQKHQQIGRYQCLIAVAHANAIASTFLPSICFFAPNKTFVS